MTGRHRGAGKAAPELPDRAWWVALAGLPGMGPARLRALHVALGGEEAWGVVAAGRAHEVPGVAEALGPAGGSLAARWSRATAELDVAERWRAHAHLGVSVLGEADHPPCLADDVEAPVVLFSQGDRSLLAGPRVAIVGTRRCTRAGLEIAGELGARCARAGVRVVSGLAVGIDAAAHQGALSVGPGGAPPVGVVATGLDVAYPPSSRALWRTVAADGVLVSEQPLGVEPAKWRFPARNRLIAALADAVVVVESPRTGGSMYTVDEALRRARTVLAVPGPLRSPASAGTNWLLSQGATVVADLDDVLTAVGVAPAPQVALALDDPRPVPTGDGRRVLRALGWAPANLDALARRTGLGLGALALALDRLEADGWVHRRAGQIERKAYP